MTLSTGAAFFKVPSPITLPTGKYDKVIDRDQKLRKRCLSATLVWFLIKSGIRNREMPGNSKNSLGIFAMNEWFHKIFFYLGKEILSNL